MTFTIPPAWAGASLEHAKALHAERHPEAKWDHEPEWLKGRYVAASVSSITAFFTALKSEGMASLGKSSPILSVHDHIILKLEKPHD